MTTRTIELAASRYEDHDDCLSAAETDVAEREGVEVWQCTARWADSECDRSMIVVEVQS